MFSTFKSAIFFLAAGTATASFLDGCRIFSFKNDATGTFDHGEYLAGVSFVEPDDPDFAGFGLSTTSSCAGGKARTLRTFRSNVVGLRWPNEDCPGAPDVGAGIGEAGGPDGAYPNCDGAPYENLENAVDPDRLLFVQDDSVACFGKDSIQPMSGDITFDFSKTPKQASIGVVGIMNAGKS